MKCQNEEKEEESMQFVKTKRGTKKIKEKRSDIKKETFPDETTYEFNLEKYPVVAPTILKTSRIINEATSQQEVVGLSTENAKTQDVKARVSIIPQNAVQSLVTHGEEKEEIQKETLNVKTFQAKSNLELNESFSIHHADTQEPLDNITASLQIESCTATKNILPNESITISEIYPDQSLGTESIHKQQQREAKVSIISHSQKLVTEFVDSTKEGEIKHDIIPQKKNATQEYVEHQSINVEEVNEAHTETQLKEHLNPMPVKPSIEYPINEQLTVSEVHSEIKSENYYPKIIVPTEVAENLIVPSKNAIETFEIEASESEINFKPFQSPNVYTADISVIPEKCIQVSESDVKENETNMIGEEIPEKSYAITDIVTQSSIIINSVNQQESEDSFTSNLPASHKAILTLNNTNKVCTSSVIEMNEAESNLEVPVHPEKKNIKTSISGLEVPHVTEILTNETETEFMSKPVLELLPDTSFIESQSCIVTETTTGDFPTNLVTTLKYEMDEAKPSFEELKAKQISLVNIQDSDIPLDKMAKPTSVKPETSFTHIHSLTVEQAVVGEQEQLLVLKTQPESHKSIITVPTHTLQAIVIEEINTENSVDNLKEDIVQPTTKKANVNFVDDKSIVVKEVSAFESETNLNQNNKPKNLKAQTVLLGHDVAETTEVISSDTIGQLNVDKYSKDKAKLEHIPHKAIFSQVIPVNEIEDTFTKKEEKQPKTVNVRVDEIIGVCVSEQPVYEKESCSIEEVNKKSKNAISEFVPIEIANRSEIVTGDYILDLIQSDTPKLHATQQPSTYESVMLCEINVSEKEQAMLDKKIPTKRLANTTIVVDEAVKITEILPNEKPSNFCEEAPKIETANTNIITLRPLESQDVLTCESVKEVKEKRPVTAAAHVSQKPLHCLETSQIVSADSEKLLSNFVIPDSKVAKTTYTELDVPINVEETFTQDKEIDFKTGTVTSFTLDRQDIVLEQSHITSETMVCNTTCDFDELVPQSVFAVTSKSPQIAIELLENAPLEKESTLLENDKTYKKFANLTYEENKGIVINEQVQLDTEENILTENIPSKRKTSITITTGQDVAETSETKVESPIEELKIEYPKQELAKIIQDKEVHSLEVSEITTQESGLSLKDTGKTHPKTANISIEGNTKSYIVTEIIPKEKEGQFSEEHNNNQHQAEQEILSFEGLQVRETISSVREEKLNDFQYSANLGKPTIEPLESIQVSEINVQELEDNFIQPFEPHMRFATHSYNENVGLVVDSAVVNDKENELIADKIKLKTATRVSNLIGYKAPENIEKTTLESVKPIEDHKDGLHQASSDHILFEGFSTTEINTHDKEVNFDKTDQTAEKTASLEFETGKTLNVTEVCLGETELNLSSTYIPRKHTAEKNISETQQVTSNFEVLTHNKIDDLHQTTPSAINITPKSTEIQSVEVAEIICHEAETPFKTLETLKNICNVTIQTDQNIEVIEIVPNELEKSLQTNEKPKSLEANIVFDQNQTLTIEKIETSDDVIPLNKNIVKPINATQQIEPFIGYSVTEVRPEETEVICQKQVKPLTKHVIPIIPQNQSLNVTSTVLIEKESTLDEFKPEITQKAKILSVYSPKPVVQSEENIVQMSTAALKTSKPNDVFLDSSQTLYNDSISQTEVNPFEKESPFKDDTSGKQEMAKMYIDTINIPGTTEIITGDKESIYVSSTRPKTKQAKINLTDSQPVGKVFEVEAEDNSNEFKLAEVNECLATPGQEVLHGVVITDFGLHDKEGIFEGEFTPSTLVAKLNIENEKEVNTITEIVPQEVEGQVKSLNMPLAKKAQVEITTGQEVAQKTEMLPNLALGSFKGDITKSSTAVPVQDTFECVLSTITVPEETEKPLHDNIVYQKSTANINIEEFKSINVTEVEVKDKEEKHDVLDVPKKQNAEKNITPTEAVETSIVLAEVNVDKFDQSKTKEELANFSHEPYINLTRSETTVHDSETKLELTENATKNAELTVISNKSLTITEVITDENNEKLSTKHQLESQKAATSLTTFHEVPQVSETIPSNTTSNVVITPENTNTSNAIITQTEMLKSTISSEVNTLEKEINFKQHPKFDGYKAEVKFKEDKSLNISETVLDEMEQPLEIDKVEEKQAKLIQSTFDSVTVSENSSVDVEQYFTSKIPEGEMVNVNFENNLNVQVSEVCAAEKENNLITPFKNPQTATILGKIDTRPVANITEIITGINVEDLPQTTQQEYVKANESHLTCKSLQQIELNASESEGVFEEPKNEFKKAIITTDTFDTIVSTEFVASEKEGNLKKEETPDIKHANISFEDINSSIVVSNIKSEDKESEFTVEPKQKTSLAMVVSDNLEALTRIEQYTSEKEGELNLNVPNDETANVTFEDSRLGILVSDTIPEDREENLPLKNKTYSQAKFKTENYESIIINEPIISEREGSLTRKPESSSTNAFISIEKPKKGAIVSEVMSHEKESDLLDTPKRKTSLVTISTKELKSFVTTENQILSNIEDLPPQQMIKKNSAKINLDELQHLTIEELVSTESESTINEKQPINLKITPTVLEYLPIEINETTLQTQTTEVNESKPKEYKAKSGKPNKKESIEVNENVILETYTELKQEIIGKQRASISATTGKINNELFCEIANYGNYYTPIRFNTKNVYRKILELIYLS